jgi:hypothetical protein
LVGSIVGGVFLTFTVFMVMLIIYKKTAHLHACRMNHKLAGSAKPEKVIPPQLIADTSSGLQFKRSTRLTSILKGRIFRISHFFAEIMVDRTTGASASLGHDTLQLVDNKRLTHKRVTYADVR